MGRLNHCIWPVSPEEAFLTNAEKPMMLERIGTDGQTANMMKRDAEQRRKGQAKQMKRTTYGGTEQNKFTRLNSTARFKFNKSIIKI